MEMGYPERAVRLDDGSGSIIIIDQALLPGQVKMLALDTLEGAWRAIKDLNVRGAPAIGICAAYAAYIAVRGSKAVDVDRLIRELKNACDYLRTSRPTAVNLFKALDRMEKAAQSLGGSAAGAVKVGDVIEALKREALSIDAEDEEMCRKIGDHGLSLLKPGMGILTHCNAGRLATSRYGTALAPVYLGNERGYGFKVYAGETRPLLQGARLTAYELMAAGVDVTLICDNMASTVMKKGWIDAVITGCDHVAANGDTANKIGTSGLAVLAKHYGIPFYICAPGSTVDLSIPDGSAIDIELRDSREVTHMWYGKPMAPEGENVFNPAFDVTDGSLITAFITEHGVVRPPFTETLAR